MLGNHLKLHKVGHGRIDVRKIRERKIVAKLLVAADAFIVVQSAENPNGTLNRLKSSGRSSRPIGSADRAAHLGR